MRRRGIDQALQLSDNIRPATQLEFESGIHKPKKGTNRFLMLSQRGMNDTTIEQNLRGIRNAIELLQRLIKLIIIVVTECCHPSLDFLFQFNHQ